MTLTVKIIITAILQMKKTKVHRGHKTCQVSNKAWGLTPNPEPFKKKCLASLYSMWDLGSPTGIEQATPVLEAQSFSHWTSREVALFKKFFWMLSLLQSIPGELILNLRVYSCFSAGCLSSGPMGDPVNRVDMSCFVQNGPGLLLCPSIININNNAFFHSQKSSCLNEKRKNYRGTLSLSNTFLVSGFAKQSSKLLQTCFILGTLLESCFWGVRGTVETKFRTTCGEKVSSLFLPLSLPAPPEGSLSGRFRKKRNKRREEKSELPICLSLAACLNSWTFGSSDSHSRSPASLSITKVTQIPPFPLSF